MALDATNQNLVLISKLFATLGTRVLHWGRALRDDPKMAAEVTKVGYSVRFFLFPSRLLVRCNVFLSIFVGVWIKGHSPFVRTGLPDLSSRKENSTIGPDYQPDQLIRKWFAQQWWVLEKNFQKRLIFHFPRPVWPASSNFWKAP